MTDFQKVANKLLAVSVVLVIITMIVITSFPKFMFFGVLLIVIANVYFIFHPKIRCPKCQKHVLWNPGFLKIPRWSFKVPKNCTKCGYQLIKDE